MQEFDSLILHDTFMDLVLYHKIFAGFFALPFVMNKKIWFIAPIIFFLLSVSVLSGINIWIFGNLELSLKIIAMITFCIFVLIGEIYRIKILKVARRTNLEAMKGYVKFCKILYIMDLLFFILLFWLA